MSASAPRIVVLGSINMDLVIRCAHLPHPGETIIGKSCTEVPGGKGANQAVAASRAGGEVTMIGRVGDDAFSDRLLANLKNQHVNICNVKPTLDCPSGVAVVAVDDHGENAIMVVPGANGRLCSDDVARAADLIRRADLLLIQLEVPLDTVAAAVSVAQQSGVPVILNPAPMPTALPAELTRVDVLCPNQSEASVILGRKVESIEDACEAAIQIRGRGAENVIVTLGSSGAVVADQSGVHHIAPFPVTAVDTTAAGDAFAGALAVRLASGDSLSTAAQFASAAGAIAATRHGAQPSMPTADEVVQLIG
jgi:ribokinase